MTLALAAVCDLDCVVSLDPLVLDLAKAESYVRGAAAIVRRVLATWARDARLLELEGSYSTGDLFLLRARLRALAEAEDFVRRCTVAFTLDEPALVIRAELTLEDGQTYTFEVTTGEAATLDLGALA